MNKIKSQPASCLLQANEILIAYYHKYKKQFNIQMGPQSYNTYLNRAGAYGWKELSKNQSSALIRHL